jgi:hypothetical protein
MAAACATVSRRRSDRVCQNVVATPNFASKANLKPSAAEMGRQFHLVWPLSISPDANGQLYFS